MLEERLKKLIETFLGEYIEGEKLGVKFNLWSAENFRAENVYLKPSVLPSSVPFRLKVGHIGELSAHIPFSTLGSSPVKLLLSDVLIVLAPRLGNEQDEENEKERLNEEKRVLLEEDLHKRQHGSVSEYEEKEQSHSTEGYFGTDGYIGRLVTRILDNLQVEAKNVHIRFEGIDSEMATTGHDGRYAIGLSLEALYAETTDQNWTTSGWNIDANGLEQNIVFKLIQFINLSLYVDPNALHLIHTSVHPKVLKSTISRLQLMADKSVDPEWWKQEPSVHAHRFLVAPLSGSLKLTMNTAAHLADTDRPRYVGNFELTQWISNIDEQQMALLMNILNVINEHTIWCERIAQRFQEEQNQNFTLERRKQYLSLWETIRCTRKNDMEALRKTDTWSELILLEKLLTLETIVTLRNKGGFERDAIDSTMSPRDVLYDIGDVLGIPLPEVSVQFQEGTIGLKLYKTDANEIAVIRCIKGGQAEKTGVIHQGFIVLRINGRPIPESESPLDVLQELNNLKEPRIVTFRHPEVEPAKVTLDRLVSSISISSPVMTLCVVSGSTRRVIVSAHLDQVEVQLNGHGPDLFSFDEYAVSLDSFYVQDSWYYDYCKSCLLSSIRNTKSTEKALSLRVNCYDPDHPVVHEKDLDTYATSIDCNVGGILLVYNSPKIDKLMLEVQNFMKVAFGENETPVDELQPILDAPAVNLKFGFSIDELEVYLGIPGVNAPRMQQQQQAVSHRDSYRTILNQLTIRGHQVDMNALQRTWSVEADMCHRAIKSITSIQKRLRGMMVRRRALPRKSDLHIDEGEMHGWVFKRDESLAFRRWNRYFAYLDENGMMCFYEDGSGRILVDKIDIRRIQRMQHVTGIAGPLSASTDVFPTIFMLSLEEDDCVLATKDYDTAQKWLDCIVIKREDVADEKPDGREPSHTYSEALEKKRSRQNFTDIYQSQTNRDLMFTNWISLHIVSLNMSMPMRYAAHIEDSALEVKLTAHSVSLWDHRQNTRHGVLRVGHSFLDMQRGRLETVVIRTKQQKKDSLTLDLTYRGIHTPHGFFNVEPGLGVDVTLSGWFLPLEVMVVIYDILEVLGFGIPAEGLTEVPATAPVDPSILTVPCVRASVRVGMMEVYIEDKSVIAKMSLESTTLHFSANTDEERLEVAWGPTALFVLTKEVALRLVKFSKMNLDYLLSAKGPKKKKLERRINVNIGRIKLEADRRMELLFAFLEAFSSTEEQSVNDEFSNIAELSFQDDSVSDFDSSKSIPDDAILTPKLSILTKQAPEHVPMTRNYSHVTMVSAPSRSGSMTEHDRLAIRPSFNAVAESNFTVLIPLICYQEFIIIRDVSDLTDSNPRTMYQSNLRIGNISDSILIQCDGIIFEVIKRSLSMIALDTYIPVMKMSFSKFRVEASTVSEFQIDYRVSMGLEVYARYYNTYLADWEPVIEPWHIHADIFKENEESGIVIQLKAMERLNINFTEALVTLICSVHKHQTPDEETINLSTENAIAVAADTEASREAGRVCVLNNLGVPVRLANLNTSNAGQLVVELRDGWSLPNYVRFHGVRIEVVLLPWWSPRDVQDLDSIRHKFVLPYGGSQPGVAPKLRIKLSSLWTAGTAYGHQQTDNAGDERGLDSPMISPKTSRRTRHKSEYWVPLGTTEIDLVGKLTSSTRQDKQWYRLRDKTGAVIGEILMALQFFPDENATTGDTTQESPAVSDGSYLLFDPLRVSSHCEDDTKHVLPGSIRGAYVPPLALEVMMGSGSSRNLLCPLRRAGKFLIMGDADVLVEVKVAQRDEYRRVVLLSSPVQFKNGTTLDINVWSYPSDHPLVVPPPGAMSAVKPGGKMSIPLNALYGDSKHLLMIQVENSEPTLLTAEQTLTGGTHILFMSPVNNQTWGYCFYVQTKSNVRSIYYEQQQGMMTQTSGSAGRHGTKYQIRVYACLTFENTLPIRIQYELRTGKGMLMRSGTLSPGEEVHWYEFERDAGIFLRLPGLDSEWSAPISLSRCITHDRKALDQSRITTPDAPDARGEDLTVDFYATRMDSNVVFEDLNSEFHLFTARLDYTVGDNGSPRVALYATLWLYNQSHIPKLLFRDTESPLSYITTATQILPDRPIPALMNCPAQSFEISTIFDDEVSHWSEKLRATTVGVQGAVTLKSGSKARVSQRRDIAIAIYRPSGRFHRSAQVVVTSRYVLVNHTSVEFEARQLTANPGYNKARIYDIPSAVNTFTPFDYDDSFFSQSISIRPKISSARWSGGFSTEEEREFPLRLRGVDNLWKSATGDPVDRIRVKISTAGATIVISLSEDIPPMFLIQNNSSFDFQFRQARTRERPEVLLSGKSTPYAWDKPNSVCEIVGRFRGMVDVGVKASTVHHYDFEQLDRDKGAVILWLGGNRTKEISAEVIVQGMSRVLVFSDEQSRMNTRYILEVNVTALRRTLSETETLPSCMKSHIDVVAASQVSRTDEVSILPHHLYRFDNESVFYFASRPRELFLNFYEYEETKTRPEVARPSETTQMDESDIFSPPDSPRDSTSDYAAFEAETQAAWPPSPVGATPGNLDHIEVDMDDMPMESVSTDRPTGSLHIKLPKKAWTALSKGTERSISDIQGYWWDLTSSTGTLVGKVQIALKFRVSNRAEKHRQAAFWIRAMVPSVGISFIHNTNMIEVAYLSCQRVHFLWSQKSGSNEVAVAIGNIQMDNQMDAKVVLGPKSMQRREGVSIRLRDRWKSCLNYGHRGVYEQVNHSNLNVIQFRMLWNPATPQNICHVELVELIVQELEIFTDEKFVVNLISVFQGLEKIATHRSFDQVIDQSVDYMHTAAPESENIYIEQLDLESLRIKFSLELNGGRHIATLGPSGRRLAVYLPESNVKNLRLYFSRLIFNHVYGPESTIFEQLYRHYQQQAVLMVLRGLYTVTLYVNPFRIVYRLGHGFLAVVKMPARGLASGSPVEFISGAYLGVRSLAVNTISASYETVAGVSGIMAAAVTAILPERKKKNFLDDMIGFQRNVMDEVDALDAVDERHMTKVIIRAPRVFNKQGIGLLTEYGPGSLPKEDQQRVDLKAVVTLQGWWRRHRLMIALYEAAEKLRPQDVEQQHQKCLIQ